MSEPIRISLFDKSFDAYGLYVIQLKSGLKACYTKRSELWKDKTACYWVTLTLAILDSKMVAILDSNEIPDLLFCEDPSNPTQLDVRYNEISAIWEI